MTENPVNPCGGSSACPVPMPANPGRGKLPAIANDDEFRRLVIELPIPVLLMFTKTACPTCVVLEPMLAHLAKEYAGRAVFAKFRVITASFRVTSPALWKSYRPYLLPTVVLFVGGQPTKRWVWKYRMASYRRALDRAIWRPSTR